MNVQAKQIYLRCNKNIILQNSVAFMRRIVAAIKNGKLGTDRHDYPITLSGWLRRMGGSWVSGLQAVMCRPLP